MQTETENKQTINLIELQQMERGSVAYAGNEMPEPKEIKGGVEIISKYVSDLGKNCVTYAASKTPDLPMLLP